MQPSKECYDLIKSEEGCILHAYHGKADRPGLWTIGYGIIVYPNGKAVRPGETCTQAQADEWLEWQANMKADQIDAALHGHDKQLSQNQFDALVDFAYNEGVEALLYKSTLWKKLLINPRDTTIFNYVVTSSVRTPAVNSCEFLKWVYANGVVVDDLIMRRGREADLYAGRAYHLKS